MYELDDRTYQRTLGGDDWLYLHRSGMISFETGDGTSVDLIHVNHVDWLMDVLRDIQRARQEDLADELHLKRRME